MCSKLGSSSRSAIGHVVNSRNDSIKEASVAAVEKLAKSVSELNVMETSVSPLSNTVPANDRQPNFHGKPTINNIDYVSSLFQNNIMTTHFRSQSKSVKQ